MIDQKTFVDQTFLIAKKLGHRIERNKDNLWQIGFRGVAGKGKVNKTLHEGHLRALYPDILQPGADIPKLIERDAPGRPCADAPMKEIIARMPT
jgi:hypothetical protein